MDKDHPISTKAGLLITYLLIQMKLVLLQWGHGYTMFTTIELNLYSLS